MKELYDYSLREHNTFGLEAKAFRFVEYDSVDELRAFLERHREEAASFLHIGGGSNLLFVRDYAGTVLHSAISGHEVVADDGDAVEVRLGAGVKWDDWVALAVSKGWHGLENLSLIPGEVGASAVQNIGAYGVEAKDLIKAVDTVCMATGELRRFSNEECRYAYRNSIFKEELKGKYIVTHVTYRLSKKPVFHLDYGNIRAELEKESCPLTPENVRRLIIRIRKEKLPDPEVLGNAGSFFMNPVVPQGRFAALKAGYPDMPCYELGDGRVKVPAGWLIERCGWKGHVRGHVGVHDRQALVLVNRGGATGEEIVRLADEIACSVRDKFGIEMRPEVNYVY